MNNTRVVLVLICILLIGETAYAVDSVDAKVEVECSGRSGAQVAIRWGHPDYGNDEYMPRFTTGCGPGIRTANLKLLDRNSQFEIQTEGGIETSYTVKVSLSDGSFIELHHASGSDVTTRGNGFTLSRSSGPNKYGEQNFRVLLQGGLTGTARIVAKSSGDRGDAQMAMRWGHRDFDENEYWPTWKIKPGIEQTKTFSLRDSASEFEIQTEGGEGTGYNLAIWLDLGQGVGMQPSIEIAHKLSGTGLSTATNGGDIFDASKGNPFGEINVRVTVPALPTVRATGPSPSWTTVYLAKQQAPAAGGPIPYLGSLSLGSGHFTQIRSADQYFDVELVGPDGSSEDCGKETGRTRIVKANQPLSASDFAFLFGQNPTYPKAFVGCSHDSRAPNSVAISVYTVPATY